MTLAFTPRPYLPVTDDGWKRAQKVGRTSSGKVKARLEILVGSGASSRYRLIYCGISLFLYERYCGIYLFLDEGPPPPRTRDSGGVVLYRECRSSRSVRAWRTRSCWGHHRQRSAAWHGSRARLFLAILSIKSQ
jgi:hypothetical protein